MNHHTDQNTPVDSEMQVLWDLPLEHKIRIFRDCFTGRTDVYGTYDPETGRSWMVRAPVTDQVLLAHLKGEHPYGVYPLTGKRTPFIVVDFDSPDYNHPLHYVIRAAHYDISAYIEKSKSKGFHVWMFFKEKGVSARKARLVAQNLLQEIDMPEVEVFPKQDMVDPGKGFGSFINAPLFGSRVPEGRTVFIHPNTLKPFPDQWRFLESIQRVEEATLDEIISVNGLEQPSPAPGKQQASFKGQGFALPPCAVKMLEQGVRDNQRVACFRLAVQLKKLGVPQDIAIGALQVWRQKNRPRDGKRIITREEIREQASWAYQKNYTGCGCEDPAIIPYCDKKCPIYKKAHSQAFASSREKKT